MPTPTVVWMVAELSDSHSLYQVPFPEGIWKVHLVTQDEDRDACQLRLVQETVQLILGGVQLLVVRCIHHVTMATGGEGPQTDTMAVRGELIMLKNLPIMLCCIAQRKYLLCSKFSLRKSFFFAHRRAKRVIWRGTYSRIVAHDRADYM